MTPAIKIEQLHKQFGALHALNGIDLTIAQGEFFALLGPNGAGKSTLINLLAGLLRPTSGRLSVMGHDNLPASGQTDPALTTMELPLADTGERLALMLLERIKTPDAKPVHDIREVRLIERGSIAPPMTL